MYLCVKSQLCNGLFTHTIEDIYVLTKFHKISPHFFSPFHRHRQNCPIIFFIHKEYEKYC